MTSDRSIEQDSEMMRLQILGDPQLMAQLQEVYRPLFSSGISIILSSL